MFWVGLIIGAPVGWFICMVVCLPHQKAKWEAEKESQVEDATLTPEQLTRKRYFKAKVEAAKKALADAKAKGWKV